MRNGSALLILALCGYGPVAQVKGPQPSVGQLQAAQAWFPQSDKCRASLKAENVAESLSNCKQAMALALTTGVLTKSDQLALIESHQLYGHALLMGNRLPEALAEESAAVELAKADLKNTDQEYAMPFFWRALVEARLGKGAEADADFIVAEDTHRRAIVNLPEEKVRYSRVLASILKQHAALLDTMGKVADAAKLRAEAASL